MDMKQLKPLFAVPAILYGLAALQDPALAIWKKGCCAGTSDCSGSLICYTSGYPQGWGACSVECREGNCDNQPQLAGYCNAPNNPSWLNDE